ncbi:MAG: hypothetical protein JO093_13475 [Acidobacteria bacterium]|nr:hypothetical protein [Acidobacteriota bacterium]
MIYTAKNKLRGKRHGADRDIRRYTHVLTLQAEGDYEAELLAAAIRQIMLAPAIESGAKPEVICAERTGRTEYVLHAIDVTYRQVAPVPAPTERIA